jgi:hypothetical protein
MWPAFLLTLCAASVALGGGIPIAIQPSDYNQDAIVEAGASTFAGAVTATMDGGSGSDFGDTWNQLGSFPLYPKTGIPSGMTVASLDDPSTTFSIQSAVGNNAVFFTGPVTQATMHLVTPTKYSQIEFFGASATFFGSSAHGNLINYSLNFADGSHETGSFVMPDWFNHGNNDVPPVLVAYGADGRVSSSAFASGIPDNLNEQNTHNTPTSFNPSIYEIPVDISNSAGILSSIDLESFGPVTTTNTCIFGISGTVVPEPGSLALCGLGIAGLGGYVLRRRRPSGGHDESRWSG